MEVLVQRRSVAIAAQPLSGRQFISETLSQSRCPTVSLSCARFREILSSREFPLEMPSFFIIVMSSKINNVRYRP